MEKGFRCLLIILAAGIIFSYSCTPKARYERKLSRELSTGVRNDSLFMGLYLGMPAKDFYLHCWELNRKGLIRQGQRDTTVEYMMEQELNHPAAMNFYPIFVEGKIFEMPVRYNYSGWAPWNKTLSADSLLLDVLSLYKKNYGKRFMYVAHPEKGKAYIKIDGNRRIAIYKENDLNVWAVFTDMLVDEKKVTESSDTTKFSTDVNHGN